MRAAAKQEPVQPTKISKKQREYHMPEIEAIVHLPVPKINSPGGADTTSGEYTELRSVA